MSYSVCSGCGHYLQVMLMGVLEAQVSYNTIASEYENNGLDSATARLPSMSVTCGENGDSKLL